LSEMTATGTYRISISLTTFSSSLRSSRSSQKILERRPSLVNHLESKPSLYERLKIFEYARIRRGLSEGGTKVWGLVNTFAFLGGVREDVEFARIIAEKEKERKMREGYGDVEVRLHEERRKAWRRAGAK